MIVAHDKLNTEALVAKPPRQFGKAKLVFLEPKQNIVSAKLNVAWPIRPASDDGNDKFSLEVSVGCLGEENEDETAFKASLSAFDQKIRSMAFANKKSWFGKEADEVSNESDLRLKHTMSIKKGNEKQDGSRYSDTVKFSVTGWQDYVDEVMYRGEGDNKFPSDVRWKVRPVTSPQGTGGPADNQTKFYICENIDPTTGKEQMVPWTPCQDPAGNEIKDANGNPTYEFVGPKHCQPGCKIRVVYQTSFVWLASKFGVTLQAKQVFITPAAAKAKYVIEGIEIKDCVDPILAKKAARMAIGSHDLRDLDDDQLGEAEAGGLDAAGFSSAGYASASSSAADASASSAAADSGESAEIKVTKSPKKRASEPAASKSKKIKVDEEF